MSEESQITHADDNTFKGLSQEGVVLVDFFADWCGPCRMLGPILEEFAQQETAIKVIKVNTDQASTISEEYQISSLPTLVLMKEGKEVERHVGLIDLQGLVQLTSKALSAKS